MNELVRKLFCCFPNQQLLDIAQFLSDNEAGGEPIVSYGLSLMQDTP